MVNPRQAVECTTGRDHSPDYEYHSIPVLLEGRVRRYFVAAICDAHVLDHEVGLLVFPHFLFLHKQHEGTTRSSYFQTTRP